jgi:hypothetical protein
MIYRVYTASTVVGFLRLGWASDVATKVGPWLLRAAQSYLDAVMLAPVMEGRLARTRRGHAGSP